MKKVLSAVLAASMAASLSAAAFAAAPTSLTLIAKNDSGDYFFDLTNVAPGTEGSVEETIWVYDDEKVEINLITATGEKVRADVNDGKITLQAICGKEAMARGVKAGDIIKTIAPICGGKGGGRPDSAMGGGSDLLKLDDALAALDDFVNDKAK